MVMLEVIIGMMFSYMLLSLLGTTINELISSWRGWRGFYLEEGLKRLLKSGEDDSIFKQFTDNAFYKQLMQHKTPLRVSRAPEYLSASNFVSILTNTLKSSKESISKVDHLLEGLPKEHSLRKVLEQLKADTPDDLDKYKTRLHQWYDDVISHSSGWYKRHLQFVTIFVGLAIAMSLNADSFEMYAHLTKNTTARQSMSQMVENFFVNNPNAPVVTTTSDSMTMEEVRTEIRNFTNSEDFANMSNVLGFGWELKDLSVSPGEWLIRILGWLVTALAISLGAPFWFNALKKAISIKSGGNEKQQPQVIINAGEKQSEE